MSSGPGYQVQPDAVRTVVSNVTSILTQILNTVRDIERLVLPASAFAAIGSPVAAANTTTQSQVTQTLHTLLSVLTQTNGSVNQAANGYTGSDQLVAQSLGAPPATSTTTPAPASALPMYPADPAAGTTATTTPAGTPGAVGTVVDYLAKARGDSAGSAAPPGLAAGTPVDFARWMNTTRHQLDAGVLGVYSGELANGQTLTGAVHAGDVVVLAPSGGTGGGEIGIVGSDGQLYNTGPIGTVTGPASVWVYRPISATATLW